MEGLASNTTTVSGPSFMWVPEPDKRGTFGILSLCFSTMILCVWSTVHFDIPTIRHSPTRRFFVQVLGMLIALLAPEALLCGAIHQRIDAGVLVKRALDCLPCPQPARPGMLVRAYNSILGRAKAEDEHHDLKEPTSPQREYPFGLVHAFYAVMGGFVFDIPRNDTTVTAEEPRSRRSTNTHYNRYVPTPMAFIYIMKYFPHIIPDIPEESITDRAESSSLGKALLIIQVGWFCTNCVSRLIQHLPLSLLEISTAAHGFCTLLTYFVWWWKPLNIAECMAMRVHEGQEAQEVHALLMCSEGEYTKALGMAQGMAAGGSPPAPTNNSKIGRAANALRRLPASEEPPESPPENPFRDPFWPSAPGAQRPETSPDTGQFFISATVSPILYGLVHYLGWSRNFPTRLEHLLWRVSSIMVTCWGLVFSLVIPILRQAEGCMFVFAILMALAYILASGFLFGESFRQLFFLEPAAYELPSWSNYWPHFS